MKSEGRQFRLERILFLMIIVAAKASAACKYDQSIVNVAEETKDKAYKRRLSVSKTQCKMLCQFSFGRKCRGYIYEPLGSKPLNCWLFDAFRTVPETGGSATLHYCQEALIGTEAPVAISQISPVVVAVAASPRSQPAPTSTISGQGPIFQTTSTSQPTTEATLTTSTISSTGVSTQATSSKPSCYDFSVNTTDVLTTQMPSEHAYVLKAPNSYYCYLYCKLNVKKWKMRVDCLGFVFEEEKKMDNCFLIGKINGNFAEGGNAVYCSKRS